MGQFTAHGPHPALHRPCPTHVSSKSIPQLKLTSGTNVLPQNKTGMLSGDRVEPRGVCWFEKSRTTSESLIGWFCSVLEEKPHSLPLSLQSFTLSEPRGQGFTLTSFSFCTNSPPSNVHLIICWDYFRTCDKEGNSSDLSWILIKICGLVPQIILLFLSL